MLLPPPPSPPPPAPSRSAPAPGSVGPPPPPHAAQGARAVRRFAAETVDWLVAGAVIVVLMTLRHAFAAWALLAGPFVVFTVGGALGAGVGELLFGLRVRETRTGVRPSIPRASLRTVVQMACSYAASLLFLLVGLALYGAAVAVLGVRGTEGGALLVGVTSAALGPPVSAAFSVLVTARGVTPWDAVSGCVVSPRRNT